MALVFEGGNQIYRYGMPTAFNLDGVFGGVWLHYFSIIVIPLQGCMVPYVLFYNSWTPTVLRFVV